MKLEGGSAILRRRQGGAGGGDGSATARGGHRSDSRPGWSESNRQRGQRGPAPGQTRRQIAARRAIVAIGRSGNFRKLGVPGEELDKVYNRLFDPKEFAGQNALVVGGGDSALETAIALATCGAHVTLSYRRKELSRAKPENIEKVEMLVRDAAADVQVEKPTSERVNTAVTSGMRGQKSVGLAQAGAWQRR